MKLEELVKNLPTIIANTIEDIYIISKDKNEAYYINYEGTSIKVEPNKGYEVFVSYINNIDKNLINEIESVDKVKKFINNYMIDSYTQDDYKIIMINDCNIDEEYNNEYNIIIADDSPIIIKFFKKIFEDRFNILVATNGDEAIKLVEENKDNNLIGCFFDLQMPIKSGYEVLDYFKDNNLFSLIPVSVISGEDSSDKIEEITSKYGIVDMLQKPFTNKSATDIVEKTIRLSSIYKG